MAVVAVRVEAVEVEGMVVVVVAAAAQVAVAVADEGMCLSWISQLILRHLGEYLMFCKLLAVLRDTRLTIFLLRWCLFSC